MSDQPNPSVAFAIAIVNGRPMLRGDCDADSAAAIESLAAFEQRPLEVDLSGVTFFDSSALGAFLRLRRRVPETVIDNPSYYVRRVLELAGVTYLTTSESDDWLRTEPGLGPDG